ncbi:MAG: peptidoglycan bridge formation glycyltransferase FemA/FemB family protein [Chloroflexi bacterium]|nr:peptidoglycan bridge formation glycyltransferase FemA/FemB family protein [Chloroflexota bacterium]
MTTSTIDTARAPDDAGLETAGTVSARDDLTRLVADDAAWDAFVAAAPNGSYPQLSAWAEASLAKGWRSTRVVTEGPTGLVGAQLLLHRMSPGPFQRAYATRGPVAAATLDRPSLAAFTGRLQRDAARYRLSHVVIDPEVAPGEVETWLSELGWRRLPAIQIDRTRIVDLTRPEEDLWSDLRSSARWSVNKARRSGFGVADEGEAGLDAFGELYLETARRVGFEANAAFRETFRAFERHGLAHLLVARDGDGTPAATLMLLDCGDRVIERYGASSRAGAQGRANYLVKWESMRRSRDRGMRWYDMWGTDHEGVAEFKASFGGVERQYIGAWELVTNRLVHDGFAGLSRLRQVRLGGSRDTTSTTGGGGTHAATSRAAGAPRVVSIDTAPPVDWDARSVAVPGGHVMQGTAWADHRRAQGADPRFVTFSDGRTALVVLRRQALAPGVVATVRRGPAHGGGTGPELAAHIGALADAMRDLGARELFVDPELDHDPAYETAMDALGALPADEYQPSIHVMRLALPAGTTEEGLWSGVAKTTRQRVRGAEKVGTVVRRDTTGELLDAFGGLLVERADDLGIAMRPELGYLAAWRRLIAAGQARLLVAEHEGVLAGGLLIFLQGGMHATAYSADRASLRRELPGTMHLVRWTAIRDALTDGATAIELGGVDLAGHREPPGPGEPNHGLYVHKASFGATWVVRTPARRLVLRPMAVRYMEARAGLLGTARRVTGALSRGAR